MPTERSVGPSSRSGRPPGRRCSPTTTARRRASPTSCCRCSPTAGATATFFVLLTRVRANLGLLRDVLDAGHEIGLHGRRPSAAHRPAGRRPPRPLPRRQGRARGSRGACRCAGRARRTARRTPRRGAPRGTSVSSRCSGASPAHDWETHAPERLPRRSSAPPARPAAVVLLHDGFADDRDGVDDGPPPSLDRIALTRGVLDEIAAAGLTGCSLGRPSRRRGRAPPVARGARRPLVGIPHVGATSTACSLSQCSGDRVGLDGRGLDDRLRPRPPASASGSRRRAAPG